MQFAGTSSGDARWIEGDAAIAGIETAALQELLQRDPGAARLAVPEIEGATLGVDAVLTLERDWML